jgi:hypothetical protein
MSVSDDFVVSSSRLSDGSIAWQVDGCLGGSTPLEAVAVTLACDNRAGAVALAAALNRHLCWSAVDPLEVEA